jgi:hypothetical protein
MGSGSRSIEISRGKTVESLFEKQIKAKRGYGHSSSGERLPSKREALRLNKQQEKKAFS